MSEFLDIEITCICGKPFIWTAGEQEFINDLHFKGKIDKVNRPKRCVPCRQKKKEERAQQEQNKDY